jgi:hypothetical protein
MKLQKTLQWAACLAAALLLHATHAADVYKWKDENGKVHFGDKISAAPGGTKVDVKTSPPPSVPASPVPMDITVPVNTKPKPKSATAVNPSQVPNGCQGLAEQIAKVKPGTNWESLYKQFNATCPGIGYECVTYRSRPENNQCNWVKRTDGNVMHTKSYP